MVANPLKRTFHFRKTSVLFFIIVICSFSRLSGATENYTGKLNINTATSEELKTLPYIGPGRALALFDCRVLLGTVTTTDTLLACDDIGPNTLQAITPYIKVSGHSDYTPPKSSANSGARKGEIFSPRKIQTGDGDIVVLADGDYFPILLEKITSARSSIDMSMFVFRTSRSKKNRPAIIVNALQSAAKQGVAIRVFLEKSGHDDKLNETNQNTARRLRKNGIRVLFDSPKVTSHTKAIVIDRRFSIVGSHNFTHSALKHNHELSLLVDSRQLAEKLTGYMENSLD